MATLELNGKDFATQTSSAEPVLASTVTGGAGLMPTGVTSLGTVTAGNLSNTAIVYPTGHVIQTTSNQYSAGDSDTMSSTTLTIVEVGSDVRHWYGEIENVLASSSVLISCQFQYVISTTSVDPGAGFGFFRLNGGTTTQIYPTTSEDTKTSYAWYFVARGTASSGLFYFGVPHLTFLDTSPGTGTNRYDLGMARNNGTVQISTGVPFHMVLQEIAG